MPARKRKGSKPLKVGFMDYKKEREKYVSWSRVIISNVITLPERKSKEVTTVRTATPTTAYVTVTLTP